MTNLTDEKIKDIVLTEEQEKEFSDGKGDESQGDTRH